MKNVFSLLLSCYKTPSCEKHNLLPRFCDECNYIEADCVCYYSEDEYYPGSYPELDCRCVDVCRC